LTNVAETGTHDDSFVSVLFVVIENLLHGLNAGIVIALEIFPGMFLVPIENLFG